MTNKPNPPSSSLETAKKVCGGREGFCNHPLRDGKDVCPCHDHPLFDGDGCIDTSLKERTEDICKNPQNWKVDLAAHDAIVADEARQAERVVMSIIFERQLAEVERRARLDEIKNLYPIGGNTPKSYFDA